MRNSSLLVEEVFSCIDNIGDVTLESEMNTLSSLIDSYDKAMMIMENYDGDIVDGFAIFQEAEESAVQSGEPSDDNSADAKKNKSFLYKALHFIPNLIKALIQFIKKAWNNDIAPAVEKGVDNIKDIPEKTKDLVDTIMGKDSEWIKSNAAKLGITAGAALTIAGIVGQITGVNNKILDATKGWWGKVKGFFKKCINRTPKLRMEWGKNVCITNLNLKAISDILGKETKDVLDSLASLSPDSSSDQINKIANAAATKIAAIKDTEIILNEERAFSFTEIPELFKNVNEHISSITDAASNAVKKLEALNEKLTANNSDPANVGTSINTLLTNLRDLSASILPTSTTFFKSFGESFNAQLDNISKVSAAVANSENEGEQTSETESDANESAESTSTGETEESTDEGNVTEDKSEEPSTEEGSTSANASEQNSSENISKARDEYKAWGKSYRSKHNGGAPSKKEKKDKRQELATKYNVDFEHVHEYMDEDIDDDDDVITESVSNGWYSR